MSTRYIHLYGAKGGVGTSTVAVLIAAELAAAGSCSLRRAYSAG
jgi:cellulose biosynthesis protein BcsQ